jgi:hypothetical protein
MNKEHRQKLAILLACKTFLKVSGMMTDAEGISIINRIMRYQDRHKIEITQQQLDSVHFKYEDNDVA